MTQIMHEERKKQLELILNSTIECEARDSTGRITYTFPAGILYENLQVLLTCISKGLQYEPYFLDSVVKIVPDGTLITPLLVRGYTSSPISFSWVDHEFGEQQRLKDIQDYFKGKYV